MDLQTQGEEIVRELGLIELLNRFGEAHLVGNLALGTTVKPDIDFLVYTPKGLWHQSADQVGLKLVEKGLTDYKFYELKERGKYLLSVNFYIEDIKWDLHITFSEKTGDYLTDSYRFFLDYRDKMTPERVKTIKRLKQFFLTKDMLKYSMSYHIYRAVIDENAKSVADIYKYLKEHKYYLGRFKSHD